MPDKEKTITKSYNFDDINCTALRKYLSKEGVYVGDFTSTRRLFYGINDVYHLKSTTVQISDYDEKKTRMFELGVFSDSGEQTKKVFNELEKILKTKD